MRIANLLLAVLWIGLSAWPVRGHAQVLRAGLFDIPPYGGKSAQGTLEGLYVDRIQRLARRADLDIGIELQPFARLPVSLQAGQIDITLGFVSPALQEAAQALVVVTHDDYLVISRKGRRLANLHDVDNAEVGRARGGCAELAQHPEVKPRWFEVPHFDSGLRMLSVGRLDALCLTRAVLQHHMALTGVASAQLGEELVLARLPVWLWVRRTLPAPLKERLRQAALQP